MPDPIIHATGAAAKYTGYGAFGAIVAVLFDVSPDVVIACLIGSILAVMLLHKFSFKIAAFVIAAGTFGSAYATPLISELNQKGIGFISAFCLVFFWGVISVAAKKALTSKIEGLGK